MKDKAQNSKTQNLPKSATITALLAQITAKEKLAEKALAAYKQKTAAYEEALEKKEEKIVVKRLLAGAKMAKHTYAIKKIEFKLAKANLKAAAKAEKKSNGDAKKKEPKFKALKQPLNVPKDSE